MSVVDLVIIILMVVCVICMIVIIAYWANLKKNERAAAGSIFLTNKKASFSKWTTWYNTLANFGPTSRFIKGLREQYVILAPNDEKFVKEKTVKTAFVIWLLSAVAVIVVIVAKPSLYLIMLAILAVYALSASYVSSRVEKYNAIIMGQFTKYISEVRTAFFRHGMIDEALSDAIPEMPHLMQTHAIKMHKVLIDDNVEEALLIYNETTPNIFMQRFVAMCVTAMKYGDSVVDGRSTFVENIKRLQKDVYAHLRRKTVERKRFQLLSGITIFPIFAIGFIENWAISTIAETEPFYKGKMGILLLFATMLCTFITYRKVNDLRSPKLADTLDHPLLQFLCNCKPIASILDNYESNNYGKMLSLRDLLRRIGSSLNNRQFILQSLCMSVCMALAICGIFGFAEYTTHKQSTTVYTDMTDKSMGSSEEVNLMITALTMYYTEEFKNVNLKKWYAERVGVELNEDPFTGDTFKEEFRQYFRTKLMEEGTPIDEDLFMKAITTYNSQRAENTKLAILYYGVSGEMLNTATDRERRKAENEKDTMLAALHEKECLDTDLSYNAVADGVLQHVKDYQTSYFKWYYLLIAIIAAIAYYQYRFISLKGNEKELQMYMKEEVIQLQSIVLSIKSISRVSQYEILENLVSFSNVFKGSLQKCLNKVDTDEMEAYEQLLEDEPFEPLQRMIKNLMTVDRIGVSQAFDDLEVEIANATDEFDQDSEFRLDDRSTLAEFISSIPTYAVIIGYLVIPIMLKSFEKLSAELSAIGQ